MTDQQVVVIDSSTVTMTNGNFSYKIDMPPNNTHNRVSLLSAEIDKSYYMVTSENNTFTCQKDSGGGYEPHATVTLDYDRNYTASELEAVLQDKLRTALNYPLLTVTYNSYTNKYTILTTLVTDNFRLLFTVNPTLSQYILGGGLLHSSSLGSWTSLYPINLQRYQLIYIKTDLIADNYNNNLAPIPCSNFPYSSIITYNASDLDSYSMKLSNNRSSNFRFNIVDKNGNNIELNYGNVRLILKLY